MSKSTGEHSFDDIITSIRYGVINSVTIHSLFIARWLFVITGLAYDVLAVLGQTSISQRADTSFSYPSTPIKETQKNLDNFVFLYSIYTKIYVRNKI